MKIVCQTLPSDSLAACYSIAKQNNLPVVLSIDLGKRNCAFWLGTIALPSTPLDTLARTKLVFFAWGIIDCEDDPLHETIDRAFFTDLATLTEMSTDVVIEKQMRINGSMCKLARHLNASMRKHHKSVTTRHAASKFITCAAPFSLKHSYEKKQRKLVSKQACFKYLFQNEHLSLWLEFYREQKKHDDYADCMWQAMDHIIRRYGALLYTKECAGRLLCLVQNPQSAFNTKQKKKSNKKKKVAAAVATSKKQKPRKRIKKVKSCDQDSSKNDPAAFSLAIELDDYKNRADSTVRRDQSESNLNSKKRPRKL